LINRIRSRGNAQVLDAGELRIVSVTLAPSVALTHVQRNAADPRRLEVVVAPSIASRGQTLQPPLPKFEFICSNLGAASKTRIEVEPQSAVTAYPLTIPVPVEAEPSGQVTISFTVKPLPPKVGTASFL